MTAAIDACKAAGAKRAVPLDVSGPFHSRLMQAAAEDFANALEGIELSMPRLPVIQNVHGHVATSVGEMRTLLVEQLYSPVRWTACVESMIGKGVQQFVECGPGSVLAGLVKRISRQRPLLGYPLHPVSMPRKSYSTRDALDEDDMSEKITALVTGAGRGIGAAIAHKLTEDGYFVVGTATSQHGAQAIDERLGDHGVGIRLDVSDSDSVANVAD